MTRLMYDSTTPGDNPDGGDLYAGYTDGRYANMAALAAAQPGKVLVAISAVGTNTGVVGDCEPGCIWPQEQIVLWVEKRRRAGVEPTVYVGAANLASVVAAFDAMGVAHPVAFWTAHYTNTPHLCGTGCAYGRGLGVNVAATQYGGDLPGHYDISLVADHWPGIDSTERPAGTGTPLTDADPGAPQSEEDDDMYTDDDRKRDAGIAWTLGQMKPQTDRLPAIHTGVDLNTWALTAEGIGLRAMLAGLASQITTGGDVDEAAIARAVIDGLPDGLARTVLDGLHARLAA